MKNFNHVRLLKHLVNFAIRNPAFAKLWRYSCPPGYSEFFHSFWEGRITKNYRFTFQIEGEICILRRIGTHDILKTP